MDTENGCFIVHRGGRAFPTAELGDVLLTPQSFQHDADLLSAE